MQLITLLDLVIVGGLAVGIWRGSRTGAVRQVAAFAGVVAAFWLGLLLMSPVGNVMVRVLALPEDVAPVIGFVTVGGIVVAGAGLLAFVARKTVSLLKLGFLDAGVGAAFGGARMAVWMSLLLVVSSASAIPGSDGLLIGSDARQASVLYDPVSAVAPALWSAFTAVTPGLQASFLSPFTPAPADDAEASDRR